MSDEILGIKGWTYSSRLQADASRIKRDTLADKGQWLSSFFRGAFVVADGSKYNVGERKRWAYISRNFAGSEVPCVTERKTF